MTRRNIISKDPPIDLEKLIDTYGADKVAEKVIQAAISKNNALIKQELKARGCEAFEGKLYEVTISETPATSFNELQAIEILRETLPPEQFSEIVKTREYIDSEELERATYSKQVDAAILAPCVTNLPPTVTLRVKKKKESKPKKS